MKDTIPVSRINSATTYHYLALGDSYTIGQSVSPAENYPNQTVQLLRNAGIYITDPDIIAVTGWTTDDLENAIQQQKPDSNYDVVTLLIGVNDQYRGESVEDYQPKFTNLLQQAIAFARNNPSHVIVISIPDWGVTPYAGVFDTAEITRQINVYNAANYTIAMAYHVQYLNITPSTLLMGNDPSLVASDGLHPSGKEYAIWSASLFPLIKKILQQA